MLNCDEWKHSGFLLIQHASPFQLNCPFARLTGPYSGPGVLRSLCVRSILAAQELGLGLWACAHLHRANQRLLFARMYSSLDIF